MYNILYEQVAKLVKNKQFFRGLSMVFLLTECWGHIVIVEIRLPNRKSRKLFINKTGL